jgi:hypothetical protein
LTVDVQKTRATDALEPAPQARLIVPLGGQTQTIREMLARLETLTAAGQRHTMSKIVSFFGAHAHRVDAHQERALAESIAWLRREAERPLPDVVSFCRRAEDLIASLSPSGR